MPPGGVDKKIIILGGLIVVFIIALVLFLIFGRKSSKPESTASSSNQLVIWDSFDGEEDLSDIITEYKRLNPDTDVTFVKKNPATYETESVNAIAEGKGPDIWIIPSDWMAKHHEKLAALADNRLDPKHKEANSKFYKDTYLDVAYKDNVISDKVYGIPLFVDSLSLYLNTGLLDSKYQDYVKAHRNVNTRELKNVFNQAPKTWDDLTTLIKFYGYGAIALGSADNVDLSGDILAALMLQYGAQMNSNDQKSALFHTASNQFSDLAYPGTKALSFYTSFAQKDNPNYTWDRKEKSAYEAFKNGQVAILIDYAEQAKKIEQDSNRSTQIAPLPQIKDSQNKIDLAYYQVLTVPKGSANSEKAWGFLTFLYNNPSLYKQYGTRTELASPLKEETKNSTDALDIQNNFSSSWYNPDPAKADKIFKSAINQVLDGQKPQTAIDGAAAEISALLQKLSEEQ